MSIPAHIPTTPPKSAAIFIACLTDGFYPRTGVAIVKILEKLGLRVEFPAEQTCCGQMFFNNGYHADSLRLAKRFIEVFEPYESIVSPSASCTAMVREQFPELLQNDPDWRERMQAVASKTYDFIEFLVKVMKVDVTKYTLPAPRTFTYHYTCHQRGLGLRDEAANLLKQIGNVQFTPMEKGDQCCGFGGTFAIKYPAISGAMVEDKVRNIEKTGAETTICNDAGCVMNISGMCNRHGIKTDVTHLANVLAEAMGIDTDEL
ncbi:MAG: (Fe-S)-binding protein [Tepidisphaeraceae bacterium]